VPWPLAVIQVKPTRTTARPSAAASRCTALGNMEILLGTEHEG
jgi:hypothetical protein